MPVRVKLKATVVRRLATEALADTISAASYQATLARGARVEHEAPTLPGTGDIVGQYRLVNKLGEGMFGSVFVAERTDVPEHRVALKLINRDVYGERDVNRELVMLAAASHPNIVELKDHGMTDTYVWLTMPLYEGETLMERLSRSTLGLREAHEIFVPIARGVEALHASGLRHQDIKPENIYLARFASQVHPVLLDLGVAVESGADFVAGTALFGAPEQLEALGGIGEPASLSEKMDVYCLASTLLFALVGEDAYPGAGAKTPFDISQAIQQRAHEPLAAGTLPELVGRPRELVTAALERWLHPDPAERSTAGEMAGELDVLLEKERSEEDEQRRRIRRQKTALQRVSFALIGSLVVVGAGVTYWVSKRETLRLAGALEAARAEGERSFDKLDTCSAEYQLSQLSLRKCADGRTADARTHEAAVGELESQKNQANHLLAAAGAKLRTCTDEAKTATEVCETERDTLLEDHKKQRAQWDTTRAALEKERDDKERAHNACEQEVVRLNQSLATCQAPPGPSPPNPAPAPGSSEGP